MHTIDDVSLSLEKLSRHILYIHTHEKREEKSYRRTQDDRSKGNRENKAQDKGAS